MRANLEEIWPRDVLEEDLHRYEEKTSYSENPLLAFGLTKRGGKLAYPLSGPSHRLIMGGRLEPERRPSPKH
ncbi:hypothetical protein [Thermococcus sp. JCM 11816]|uniref:hypothetical protein n=1 Tax=Thermococcus sp. (strain JCM 11816 / KS-1) TaxID=1295125 RepID=UPI0006CF5483